MKFLAIYGTRPEAIKMGPIVRALIQSNEFEISVMTTGQHPEMVKLINSLFGIDVTFDEDIFEHGQSVNLIVAKSLAKIDLILERHRPDGILVQGDTSTSLAGALAGFQRSIPVIHVEAGLRTATKYIPFPEELNRRLIGQIATLHFAATKTGRENLLSEGIDEGSIFVTGNSVVDAAQFIMERHASLAHQTSNKWGNAKRPYILVTLHRRESWGEPVRQVANALKKIAEVFLDVDLIVPMHPNPILREILIPILSDLDNVLLIEPLDYEQNIQALANCRFVVTDSGGIQEEAPIFRKPVLVLRNETERVEGLLTGSSKLIGTETQKVFDSISRLMLESEDFNRMSSAVNPYGDGLASQRIVDVFRWYFLGGTKPQEFELKLPL